MPTIGEVTLNPPVDRRTGAPPRLKTRRSAATSHAPGVPAGPVPDAPTLPPAPSPELAIEAAVPRTLDSAVVAARRPTRRRRPRRGRPMMRIYPGRFTARVFDSCPFGVKRPVEDLVWTWLAPG